MKQIKQRLALVLALTMLAGCGAKPSSEYAQRGGESDVPQDEAQAADVNTVTVSQSNAAALFQKQELVDRSDISHMSVDNGTVYYSVGQEIYQYQDGTETLCYTAQDTLVAFSVENGVLWVSTGDGWVEEESYQQSYAVTEVHGDTESRFELSELPDVYGGVYAFAPGPEGQIYGLSSEYLLELGDGAALTRTIPLDGADADSPLLLDALAASKAGTVYAGCNRANYELYTLEADSLKSYLAVSNADLSSGILGPGGNGYDFYLADADSLLAAANGSLQKLASWADSGISFLSIEAFAPLDADSFAVLDSGHIYTLSPAAPEEVTPSATVTIGVDFDTGFLESAIALFNAANPAYHVEMKEYVSGSYSGDALEDARLDLSAGQGPDILALSDMFIGLSDMEVLGKNGYLMDIKPEMEALYADCPTLSIAENHGTLYSVFAGFSINTAVGLTSEWGDQHGWTFDEYESLAASGDVFRYMRNDIFLTNSFPALEKQLIDFDAGTCRFDSTEFIHLLTLSAQQEDTNSRRDDDDYPSEAYYLPSGDFHAAKLTVRSLAEFASLENAVGQELTFIGLPTLDGSCGSYLRTDRFYGVNAAGNTEGAIAFLKFLLTDSQVQASTAGYRCFPVLESAMDTVVDLSAAGDIEFEQGFDRATDAQIQKIKDLMTELDCIQCYDAVYDIILEETAALFAGDKSPEDTADIIQNRVSIYLAEQS